jgi:uncharacterized protein (DUF885 family)
MYKMRWVVSLCVTTLLTVHFAVGEHPNASAQERANQLVDQYFDIFYRFHPTDGTNAGFHQYDSLLEDFSYANLDRESQSLKGLLPEIQGLLSEHPPQAIAHDLMFLQSQARSRLLDLETIRMWQKDPDPYASSPAYSIFVVMKRDFAPPEDRLRSVIAREKQIPAAFAAARQNLKNPPRVYTEVALEQLPGTIEFFRNEVPGAFRSVKDPALLADFHAANNAVLEAYQNYEKFLREDLLPASHGDFRLGVDAFRKKLLYDEMVDIPIDRLREIAYADLRHNQQWLTQVASQIDSKHSPREVVANLQNDHPAPAELLPTFRDVLASLRQFIAEKKIMTIPSNMEPVVEETPPFARALTTAAMETPGPYETKAKVGIFEVTVPDPAWTPDHVQEYLKGFSRGTIVSTATHEVYPGHYMQYLWSLTAPSKTRKLLYCDTNSEGWAHYTEQMMLDEGYAAPPANATPEQVRESKLIRLGQLQDALLRDASFVNAIKLHTGLAEPNQQWTIEQSVDFFAKEGFQSRSVGLVETKRGTSDATYLYYTLGKLEIMKLREDLRRKQGSAFSLEAFHDSFMRQGPAPIKIIRKAMLHDDSPVL